MTKKRYSSFLCQKEIIALLQRKVYRVAPNIGVVYGPKGVVLPFFTEGRAYVRLYWNQKKKVIGVARLVWMSVTLTVIPRRYEVHHRDEDKSNNAWENLLCLHKLDHRKLHEEQEEIPF